MNSNFIEEQNREVEKLANEVKSKDDCVNNNLNILKLYAIRDLVLNKFMPPFFATCDEEAKRTIKSTVDFSNTLLSQFPNNYVLYFVGYYDTLTGCLDGVDENNGAYFVGEICNLSELQSDTSKQYYLVLNSINEKLNVFDNAISEAKSISAELKKREDMIARRTSKVEAILDSNVDLFPIPVDSKEVAQSMSSKLEKIDGVQQIRDAVLNS